MSRHYKPRRQSKRWLDGDCPKGVLAILDNKGESADRYTVYYAEPICGTTYGDMILGYRAMSSCPFHPQGVGLYGEAKAYEVAEYRYRKKHQYAKWSSLPDDCKKLVRRDLEETADA